MNPALLKRDLASFALHAARQQGFTIEPEPYFFFLARRIQEMGDVDGARLIVNLPPRHLKSFLGVVAHVAWRLACNPALRVMVVTHSETLAADLAGKLMALVGADWYAEAFGVRLSRSKRAATDFMTEQNGACFFASVRSGFTGRGADLIILDDLVDIADSNNENVHNEIEEIFRTKILNRLNNPARGSILLIAHRLHESDLPGALIEDGGWEVISLPIVAEDDIQLAPDFVRAKGSVLRPSAFTNEILEDLRLTNNFDALYMQRPGGDPNQRVSVEWLRAYSHAPAAGSIISVDCGGSQGARSSFSAVQVWTRADGNFYLLDAVRGRWSAEELHGSILSRIRKHRPLAILIERNSFGLVSIDRLKRRNHPVHEIVPSASKAERMAEHLDLFKAGLVFFPPEFGIRLADFVEELTSFPNAPFSDQVDAMTQALAWLRVHRDELRRPPDRCMGATGRGYIAGR